MTGPCEVFSGECEPCLTGDGSGVYRRRGRVFGTAAHRGLRKQTSRRQVSTRGGEYNQAAGKSPAQATGGSPAQAAGGSPAQAAGGSPAQAAGGSLAQAAGGVQRRQRGLSQIIQYYSLGSGRG